MKAFRLSLAIVLATSMLPVITQVAQAQGKCAGGLQACVERCQKAGGQASFCPQWCRKERGC